jgi:hypothetical protein
MLIEALLGPRADGVKVSSIVQLSPGASPTPQVFVWVKSPELTPLSPMLLRLRNASPVLVRVIPWAALVVFTL